MPFFRDCQQWIVDVTPPEQLQSYRNLNADCARLVSQPTPPQQCSALRGDVCEGNTCRRFVGSGMRGRSCAEYCCEFGLGCVGAWEEVDDNCAEEDSWTCQQSEKRGGGTTDDVICECDGDGSTLMAPCPTPAPAPALPSVPPRPPSVVVGLTEGGTTQLPIVLITTDDGRQIRDDPRIYATLITLDSGPNERNAISSTRPTVYEDSWTGTISIEIRGSTSAGFPKKQYGFETQVDATSGDNADVSLLGLPAENDWVLNAPVRAHH
jgi:hypothetical protein